MKRFLHFNGNNNNNIKALVSDIRNETTTSIHNRFRAKTKDISSLRDQNHDDHHHHDNDEEDDEPRSFLCSSKTSKSLHKVITGRGKNILNKSYGFCKKIIKKRHRNRRNNTDGSFISRTGSLSRSDIINPAAAVAPSVSHDNESYDDDDDDDDQIDTENNDDDDDHQVSEEQNNDDPIISQTSSTSWQDDIYFSILSTVFRDDRIDSNNNDDEDNAPSSQRIRCDSVDPDGVVNGIVQDTAAAEGQTRINQIFPQERYTPDPDGSVLLQGYKNQKHYHKTDPDDNNLSKNTGTCDFDHQDDFIKEDRHVYTPDPDGSVLHALYNNKHKKHFKDPDSENLTKNICDFDQHDDNVIVDYRHNVTVTDNISVPNETIENGLINKDEQAERLVMDYESGGGPTYKDQLGPVVSSSQSSSRNKKKTRVNITKDSIAPCMATATLVQEEENSSSTTHQPEQHRERHVRFSEPNLAAASNVTDEGISDRPTSRRRRLFSRVFTKLLNLYHGPATRVLRSRHEDHRGHQRRLQQSIRGHQQQRRRSSSNGSVIIPSSIIVDAWPIEEDVTSVLEQQSSRIDRLERFAREESSRISTGTFLRSEAGSIRLRNPLRRVASDSSINHSLDPRQWAVDRLAILAEMSIRSSSVASLEDPPAYNFVPDNTTTTNNTELVLSSSSSSVDPPESICFDGILFRYENLIKVQSMIRTWLCQKKYNRWKKQELVQKNTAAALTIQSKWRRFKHACLIDIKTQATMHILNSFGFHLGVLHDILLCTCIKYVAMYKQAIVIQRVFRGSYTRRLGCSVGPKNSKKSIHFNLANCQKSSDERAIGCVENAPSLNEGFLSACVDTCCPRLFITNDSTKSLSCSNCELELSSSVLKIVRECRRKKQPIVFFDELFARLVCCDSRESLLNCLKHLAGCGEVVYFGTKISEPLSKIIVISEDWMSYIVRHMQRKEFFKEVDNSKRFSRLQSEHSEHTGPVTCDWTDQMNRNTFPVVSSHDVRLDWLSLRNVNRALCPSLNDDPIHNRNTELALFDFLESLMIQRGILVPCSSGERFSSQDPQLSSETPRKETKFFLPDHLEWSDTASSWVYTTAWYRPLYSWEAAVCHSWSFSEPIPNTTWGLILARLVSNFTESPLVVDDMQCWKDAAAVVIGCTEIFLRCENVSGRILACGRGAGEFAGKFIWKRGGFQAVVDAISSVLYQLETENHILCPLCLDYGSPDNASKFKCDYIETAANRRRPFVICDKGHRVGTQLLSGRFFSNQNCLHPTSSCLCKVMTSLHPSIVQILVWDDVGKRVTSLGSGFIVDAKRGLVVTAAHVIYHMDNKHGLFGKGRGTRIFIGIITDEHVASFRYYAVPVAQDIQNVDACVLRLRTRLNDDITTINDLASLRDMGHPIDNNNVMANENLQSLPMTDRFMMEEHVRVLGFNQHEDAVRDVVCDKQQDYCRIFRSVDVVKGYVCRYVDKSDCMPLLNSSSTSTLVYSARKELVIDCCSTLSGDSGGPCLNNEGKVIGVLSRGRGNRSFVVPSCEIEQLVKSCVF